eukprot:TRINITY_DN7129_c0_g1_i1.p1 TRINITY_DN7129_c0_g1~~TRINITY_DN7129_c0_g1_i1.p1  ORF type:complete len:673 (+),score=242.69 TRINITY_DN7129_c0_g1_i1:48-2021(+)
MPEAGARPQTAHAPRQGAAGGGINAARQQSRDSRPSSAPPGSGSAYLTQLLTREAAAQRVCWLQARRQSREFDDRTPAADLLAQVEVESLQSAARSVAASELMQRGDLWEREDRDYEELLAVMRVAEGAVPAAGSERSARRIIGSEEAAARAERHALFGAGRRSAQAAAERRAAATALVVVEPECLSARFLAEGQEAVARHQLELWAPFRRVEFGECPAGRRLVATLWSVGAAELAERLDVALQSAAVAADAAAAMRKLAHAAGARALQRVRNEHVHCCNRMRRSERHHRSKLLAEWVTVKEEARGRRWEWAAIRLQATWRRVRGQRELRRRQRLQRVYLSGAVNDADRQREEHEAEVLREELRKDRVEAATILVFFDGDGCCPSFDLEQVRMAYLRLRRLERRYRGKLHALEVQARYVNVGRVAAAAFAERCLRQREEIFSAADSAAAATAAEEADARAELVQAAHFVGWGRMLRVQRERDDRRSTADAETDGRLQLEEDERGQRLGMWETRRGDYARSRWRTRVVADAEAAAESAREAVLRDNERAERYARRTEFACLCNRELSRRVSVESAEAFARNVAVGDEAEAARPMRYRQARGVCRVLFGERRGRVATVALESRTRAAALQAFEYDGVELRYERALQLGSDPSATAARRA